MFSVKKNIWKIVGLLGFLKTIFQQLLLTKNIFNGNFTLQFCSSNNVILYSNSSLLFRNVWSKAPPVDTLCVVTCKPQENYIYFASFTGYNLQFTKSTLFTEHVQNLYGKRQITLVAISALISEISNIDGRRQGELVTAPNGTQDTRPFYGWCPCLKVDVFLP